MLYRHSVVVLAWICYGISHCDSSSAAFEDERRAELVAVSVKDYGVEVQVPAHWRLVAKAEETMVFGISIPNDSPDLESGIKCVIGPAPENLEEFRSRITRRAERQRASGVALKRNELVKFDGGERLETEWNYEPADRPIIHDLEIGIIANDQLYTFTLRAADPVYKALHEQFEAVLATVKFTPPETGLEVTEEGYCLQKRFRFGLKLPEGWRPSFPLSNESLFWATSRPRGIWNDNLLVIASKPRPLDLEALAKVLPDKLREEDPQCLVKSCKRVTQGKMGEALETVVETQRGPFRITVLERRYTGHRYNYEIKFTVATEEFDKNSEAIRRSADSFVEFVAADGAEAGTI